jgi:hypothetical protein
LLTYRKLCPEECGICHEDGCTAANDDVRFSTAAEAFGLSSRGCGELSTERCNPTDFLGVALAVRTVCPELCGLCRLDDPTTLWLSATYSAVYGATGCTSGAQLKVQASFTAMLLDAGISKQDVGRLETGCGSVWIRVEFDSVDVGRAALQAAKRNAVQFGLVDGAEAAVPTVVASHGDLAVGSTTAKQTTADPITSTRATTFTSTPTSTASPSAETTTTTGCDDVGGEADCMRLAAAGFCVTAAAPMAVQCARSCGLCPDDLDAVVVQDWLAPTNNNNNNNNNTNDNSSSSSSSSNGDGMSTVLIGADGEHYFIGQTGLLITAPTALTNELTVAMQVQLRRGAGGYLFAKTSASGDERYLALYASAVRKDVTFYYRTAGRQRRVRFRVQLTDGREHTVLLSVGVGGTYVTLRVDGAVVGGAPRRLGGDTSNGLEDCGAPTDDCVLFVGQRANGLRDGGGGGGGSSRWSAAYQLTGIVRDARYIFDASLSHYPPKQ